MIPWMSSGSSKRTKSEAIDGNGVRHMTGMSTTGIINSLQRILLPHYCGLFIIKSTHCCFSLGALHRRDSTRTDDDNAKKALGMGHCFLNAMQPHVLVGPCTRPIRHCMRQILSEPCPNGHQSTTHSAHSRWKSIVDNCGGLMGHPIGHCQSALLTRQLPFHSST